jgi:hypothetical protein
LLRIKSFLVSRRRGIVSFGYFSINLLLLKGPNMTFSTPHTRDTLAPQDYWQHAAVAITKSAGLIKIGLAGVVHGVLPEIKGLQFYTSSGVLRAAKFLIASRRHDPEIRRILGEDFLQYVQHVRDRDDAKSALPSPPSSGSSQGVREADARQLLDARAARPVAPASAQPREPAPRGRPLSFDALELNF